MLLLPQPHIQSLLSGVHKDAAEVNCDWAMLGPEVRNQKTRNYVWGGTVFCVEARWIRTEMENLNCLSKEIVQKVRYGEIRSGERR